jgi:hypothetical protein
MNPVPLVALRNMNQFNRRVESMGINRDLENDFQSREMSLDDIKASVLSADKRGVDKWLLSKSDFENDRLSVLSSNSKRIQLTEEDDDFVIDVYKSDNLVKKLFFEVFTTTPTQLQLFIELVPLISELERVDYLVIQSWGVRNVFRKIMDFGVDDLNPAWDTEDRIILETDEPWKLQRVNCHEFDSKNSFSPFMIYDSSVRYGSLFRMGDNDLDIRIVKDLGIGGSFIAFNVENKREATTRYRETTSIMGEGQHYIIALDIITIDHPIGGRKRIMVIYDGCE